MPWLTPDSIPEDDACRPLSIPADSAWLALVSGALTELTKPYNWQKFGTLTVQETVDEMQAIVDGYYNNPCAGACLTPGDYRVTRISPTGHLEELGDDGTWQPATDEYAIPAPEARTEGTVPDQNCLAAKNATEVLSQLYESLSESFSSELSTDEAITAFIAAAVAVIGFEFAPITWSIAAVGFVAFEALFQALQYLTADLWTEEFSQEFICLLLGCALNTAGVVTFDWDCFNAALLRQVNDRGLSEVQMRLYVQIGYMLHFIGGVDGLNLAARTTSITDDDCSACDDSAWIVEYDFTGGKTFGFKTLISGGIPRGGYVGGEWIATPQGGVVALFLYKEIVGLQVTQMSALIEAAHGTGLGNLHRVFDVTGVSPVTISTEESGALIDTSPAAWVVDGAISFTTTEGWGADWNGDTNGSGSVTLYKLRLAGTGTPPPDGVRVSSLS